MTGIRDYLVIMYSCDKTNKSLEKDIKALARKYKYKFIGSGYDFTNDKRDMEFRKKGD